MELILEVIMELAVQYFLQYEWRNLIKHRYAIKYDFYFRSLIHLL
jgi:hypothetical protein